jgi:hypothetical protein
MLADQGHGAMRTYAHALQLATAQSDPVVRGTAGLYVGMSTLECERNDLHAATQHLQRSQQLGEHTGLPQHQGRWRVAQARIREAQGDLIGALVLLDEAERRYVSDFLPNVRPVVALKIRVWLAQGRLGEAIDWARNLLVLMRLSTAPPALAGLWYFIFHVCRFLPLQGQKRHTSSYTISALSS